MFYYLFEIITGMVFITILLTQVTIPAVRGRRLFPLLRRNAGSDVAQRRRRLQETLARRQAELELVQLELGVAELERQIAQCESRGEQVSADALRKRLETLRQSTN